MSTTTKAPIRAYSGIQPSGAPHLGNDLGAIRNYVALQENYESIYCIVDYHALTSVHDGDRLRRQTREMAAALIALGLDPNKCTLFVQSHRPEVLELDVVGAAPLYRLRMLGA
jgi:tryptophanyl-tRNA synthetase